MDTAFFFKLSIVNSWWLKQRNEHEDFQLWALDANSSSQPLLALADGSFLAQHLKFLLAENKL